MLILDCDTDLDIKVVEDVVAKLKSIDIIPLLAVPGELLLRGSEVYRNLMNNGIEFLNHGFVQHTSVDAQRAHYTSSFFYDQLTREDVIEDIRKGHETLVTEFGFHPTAFRTPHFGTFCKLEDLEFLHEVISDLNYEFSTSSTPGYFLKKGYFWKSKNSIWEIPVTGCPTWPLGIPDSYNFRFAPARKFSESDYVHEVTKLSKFLVQKTVRRINIYVDPSQVYDWPDFFKAMNNFRGYSISKISDYIGE